MPFIFREEGHQLSGMSNSGTSVTYKYNDDGIRTQKTVNGVTTKYHLVGDTVTSETNGTDTINYTYDADGNLVSMNLNGTEYYYIYDGVGNIIGLFDSTGTQVVSYTYDTWGKLISITGSLAGTVGIKNPYRYHGYRYDTETGLYYLQSRYYNPEWGRFINADSTDMLDNSGELLNNNLFAYCENNPVNNFDPDGTFTRSLRSIEFNFKLLAHIFAGIWTINIVARNFAGHAISHVYNSAVNKVRISYTKTKKQSKKSGKEMATDAPSWAKNEKPKSGERAEEFTKRILNNKYGKDNYKKGSGSEYSKILKRAHRKLGLK